jgi:hypothetical protein
VNNVEAQSQYQEYDEPEEPEQQQQQTKVINGVGGIWSMSKQIGHVQKVKEVTVVSVNRFDALRTEVNDDVECIQCDRSLGDCYGCNLQEPPGLHKSQRMPAVKNRKS